MKYANRLKAVALSATALLGLMVLASVTLAQDAATPAPAPAPAAAPASAAPAVPAAAAFKVYPAEVNLETARDNQAFVVQVTQPDGVTRDVTAEAQVSIANPALAKIEGNVLTPLADGQTDLVVAHNGQTVNVPLTVKQAAADRPVSFTLDVMPVFLRAGCNSGSCHGAARGKDGFRLSLFGYDADGDFQRITREIATRRVNLALPAESLMIQKSIGAVPHTGGAPVKPDSIHYQSMVRWLEAGAPKDPAQVATPVSMEILPKQAVLEEGTAHRMTVRAKYSDGTDRDVTNLALFMSNNDTSAKIDGDGKVTAGVRGEAFVMARFATFTVGSQVITVPKGLQYQWPGTPENNYVDTLVNNKFKKLRILPSELCDDQTFLRRASLDITGLLPTPEEHAAFLASTDPQKREKLVDELLGRKEFVEVWVMKFAELLQVRTIDQGNQLSYKGALLYYNWLQERIAGNVPMDQIVRELIGADGGTFKNPATNYYQTELDTLKVAENTAQVFMGMRIQCAQCHNHPFDQWTQNDYYHFVSFFTQVGRKQGEDPRERIIFNAGGGEFAHPVTGQALPPKFLGGAQPDLQGKDRRKALAEWLASPENPFFARNLANIVWAHFLGKGIIDPVDDVRISNPPSNPELLDELAKRFTEYNYDFKRLVRDICTSRTYQLATRTNETNAGDTRNFASGAIRRIRAEVLLDCISQVTAGKEKFQGLPLGSRAVQIANGNTTNYFLTTFGRATRETVCSCEVKMEPNLSQALHLLNGDTVQNKVNGGGVINQLVDERKLTPEQAIENLYVRCLTRKPTPQEVEKITAMLKEPGADPKQILTDLFWALLNSQEFMFNH